MSKVGCIVVGSGEDRRGGVLTPLSILLQIVAVVVALGRVDDDNWGAAENEGRRPIDQYLQS